MSHFLKKSGGWLFSSLMALWAVTSKALDWIGRTTLPDDWRQLMTERLPDWASWLFSTPAWVPALLALAGFAWMVYVTYPGRALGGPVNAKTKNGGVRLTEVSDVTYRNQNIRFDGKHFIRCAFDGCTIQYDGGPFRITECKATVGTRLISTNQAVVGTLILGRLAGLLHEEAKEMRFELDTSQN